MAKLTYLSAFNVIENLKWKMINNQVDFDIKLIFFTQVARTLPNFSTKLSTWF